MKLWSIVVFLFLFSFITVNAIPTVEIGTIDNNLPIVQMGNGKSICSAGFMAQNLTKNGMLECVAVAAVINVSNVNFSGANLTGYAKLDGSTGSFFDGSLKDSISTALRILYNNAGNSLCTWSNALGTGFDCVTLSQNGNTVCDISGNCNSTYGGNSSFNQSLTDNLYLKNNSFSKCPKNMIGMGNYDFPCLITNCIELQSVNENLTLYYKLHNDTYYTYIQSDLIFDARTELKNNPTNTEYIKI
jgi:hypothetical protein